MAIGDPSLNKGKCPSCGACKECGARPQPIIVYPQVPYVPYRPPYDPYPYVQRPYPYTTWGGSQSGASSSPSAQSHYQNFC